MTDAQRVRAMAVDLPRRFEEQRLALFTAHGFDGRSTRITDHAGNETYAMVRGEGSTPTVLVHGGVGSGAEWALIASRIEGPLVMPDRPGCGLSYAMDYRKVDFRSSAADWLLNLVDGLGAEKVNLIGGSMGGFFAMAFATAHPERVRVLGLLGAAPGLHREFPLFLRLYANPIVGRLIAKVDMSDPEKQRKRVFASYLTHPDRLPLEILEVAAAGTTLPGTALTARTIMNAVATIGGLRPEIIMRDDMVRLTVPTRFVWGDHDTVLPAASGASLASQMTDAKVVLISDAGHLPHLDQPVVVADAINSFIR